MTAGAVWQKLRKRPKRSLALLVFLVLLIVPIWPFFPNCNDGGYPGRTIFRYMSPEYRHALKAFFRAYGVYHWDIGGIVFIRLLPILDTGVDFHQDDAIRNAEAKAAAALVDPDFIGSRVGVEIDGKIYRPPTWLRDLVNGTTGIFPYDKCDVMPYIVTMTPPPERRAK